MPAFGPPYDTNNVFAKILRGEIPSDKIFETDDVLAILDAFPCTRGHSLLIPKVSGYTNILDLPPHEAAKLFQELPRLAKAVQEAVGCDGINIVQNNGRASGQEVFHPHIHVIPRFQGDNLLRLPSLADPIDRTDAAILLELIQGKL
ncbi:hypothetical protein DYB28_009797 [Aphanomyces astaci]|uniref:HIT domain-containing protein n=1 Tax=Aphanomyces astaci TaxID=112090 RepID=A0A397EDG0_APHAT|nr:hypothetical protein DYB25_002532 [Aphanomyces astaci]RHY03282.1 hypothetical protein DYB36_008269 [Aphanomyces astaci]RHY40337.1 hypothetical protein DYB38_003078 [Aphanomyces astaci]RHY54364.1 hypothetical protein DYB34_008586 [Aphanomyces astaci]RHY76720.1 hypothetical protein DYB30_002879 [Aphanomyces astaci]